MVAAFNILLSDKQVKAILVNIFGEFMYLVLLMGWLLGNCF